jgi:hypothetical protein
VVLPGKVKIAPFHSAIFATHLRRPFLYRQTPNKQRKSKSGVQKILVSPLCDIHPKNKTRQKTNKQKPQPCPASCRSGQENGVLIRTQPVSLHKFKKA